MLKYVIFLIRIIKIFNLEFPLIKSFSNKKNIRNLNDNFETLLYKLTSNLYNLNLSLGTPNQYFNLIFDTSSSNFWVYDFNCKICNYNNSFKKNISSSFKNGTFKKELKYFSNEIKGIVNSETLEFEKIKILSFKFLLINNSTIKNKIDGIIGFNKLIDKDHYSCSFIDQLIDKRKIKKRIFLIDIINTGKMYIGEIPNHLIKSERLVYGNNKLNNDWIVSFNKISFNNQSIYLNISQKQNEQDFIINSLIDGLFFPLKFIDSFKNHLFNNLCNVIVEKNISHFQCDNKKIISNNTFLSNNITFYFLNNSINLSLNYLVNKEDNTLKLYFVNSTDNNFILGIPFLESHAILFDKDNKMVTLFKNKYKVEQKQQNVYIRKLTETVTIAITMLIFIALICGSFCYLNKQRATKRITKDMIETNVKYQPIT